MLWIGRLPKAREVAADGTLASQGPVPTTPSLTILFAVALSLWPKMQTLKVQSPLRFPLPFTPAPGVSEQGLGEIPARRLPLHVYSEDIGDLDATTPGPCLCEDSHSSARN